MISFNVPPCIGKEMPYIEEAIKSHKICGDGKFTKKCSKWIEETTVQAESVVNNVMYTCNRNGCYFVGY